MSALYAGLMSGTSLDGVDAVLADFSDARPQVLGHRHQGLDARLRADLLALCAAGDDELHRCARAGAALADAYAGVLSALLTDCGVAPTAVRAVGAHGQTVRHRPDAGYTIQLLAPARLAERCGIDVVADLRSRDMAAGGQGAPLVPALHAAVFSGAAPRAVVNVGGIANVTLLPAQGSSAAVTGFDCGPGNVLMDLWIARQRGLPFDADGAWARSGHADPALLRALQADPYFAAPPPKSTGREHFHAAWLDAHLAPHGGIGAADVQATLLELTADTIVQAVQAHGPDALIVCGGGAFNGALMDALGARLSACAVGSSELHGVPPDQVEALAFAWLARAHCMRLPGNVPAVTGARGPRVLGALYPA